MSRIASTRRQLQLIATTAIALTTLTGCLGPQGFAPGERLERVGDEIVVAGQLFHTGAPVVLWMDKGGYDAYRVECKFDPEVMHPKRQKDPKPNRYSSVRGHLPEDVKADVQSNGWSLEELQDHIDLFVIHYDVCGTSRQCFKVLHDLRGLSVQFMLDLDGTIYQTLDLKERAWHAGSANDRSVGIEIANIGAYKNMDTLNKWYSKDEDGRPYVTLPKWMKKDGIKTPDYVARPARDEPVKGNIQGTDLMQYDLTDAQYESLIKLTATLNAALPKIELDYPRNDDGTLRTVAFDEAEMADYSGVLGHYHVTKRKTDPGPAFDWDRVINGARKLSR
ncbi:MAG TPA: N-acetylmuramoyl-L-alanine amidase [Phycisphaerae bacterium]|nr:N-acetylmuramoyl-L-alanine amidase [Phycisphaerae bacterium]